MISMVRPKTTNLGVRSSNLFGRTISYETVNLSGVDDYPAITHPIVVEGRPIYQTQPPSTI